MMKNTKQHIKILRNVAIFYLSICIFVYLHIPNAYAGPSSTHFQIQSYSFGAGGTTNSSSNSFGLNAIAGEVEFGQLYSTNFKANTGLTSLLTSNVPDAPILSIPANNYDRIKIVLNTSNNPSDTTFAIQLSTTSNFASNVYYVKSDDTIGTTLTTSDFKTNTNWGSSGFFAINLTSGTTYYVRVKARQGNYTETPWGPSASITTGTATLTFSLSSESVSFNNLNSGNSYTDSAQSTTLTTSTNAYNGFTVYGYDDKALTDPNNNTIANYSSPNSGPTSWSGTGFGYTTNDTSLGGSGGANRFNTGANYAGFSTSSPGDPVADDTGPVQSSQISNEAFVLSYRVTASSVTTAGTYSNTIIYTIVPAY